MNDVGLEIDGLIYEGWTEVEVQRSLEQIAGQFQLHLVQPAVAGVPPIREGQACTVRIGSDVVLSGYIDLFECELSDKTSSITVHGRDKTGDLVDCSAIHSTGQWHGVKLEQIVRDIAKPFGITVLVKADTGETFKSFALEDGEKAFDAIDRACRMRAVLCTSTPLGELLLTEASDEALDVELVEGVNIRRISATHTWQERYSTITMKGQVAGDDAVNGSSAAHQKAQATDSEINRYRPLIVVAEHGSSDASLADRAKWEVAIRMGRGKRGRVTVVGWRMGRDGSGGALWTPNNLVLIRSPKMFLDMEMLIVGCSYALTANGTTTELVFARREAFDLVEGIGRSKLRGRLNDKTKREKKKRVDGPSGPWVLTPEPEAKR